MPGWPGPELGASDVLETFGRMLAVLLAATQHSPSQRNSGPLPMLTVQQTAALLGLSRTTVIRKADAGELPCVVVSRGARQKMRRFPRSAIEELAISGGGVAQIDLSAYTAQWLGGHATRTAVTSTEDATRDVTAGQARN